MRFPKKEQIEEVLKNINDEDFSEILPADASHIDKTKYELCEKFVTYIYHEDISQAELARKMGINRSRINWIIKYRIEKFTIDKLYELWISIDPDFQLKVS